MSEKRKVQELASFTPRGHWYTARDLSVFCGLEWTPKQIAWIIGHTLNTGPFERKEDHANNTQRYQYRRI